MLTERGHKEAKQLLPETVRVSALRKLKVDDGEPITGEGFDEYATAVRMTAAVLTGAGFGTPLSRQTETAHLLPHGYTQYTDLTMRAPDAGVPAMLLEVDRVNEPAAAGASVPDDRRPAARRRAPGAVPFHPRATAHVPDRQQHRADPSGVRIDWPAYDRLPCA
ncbi:hypothetical protein [Streptomyces sp. NPDC023327]|uniref:hypothetical protein n=1 Tax=Streptomyces sp. NPDC023327 TaxID=3157088 RepID=UPI0033D14847